MVPMLERDFQTQVIDWAHTFGWHVAAFRPARTAHGYRTAVQGDGSGWPDLTLVHPEAGVWFRELKCGRNKLDPEQEAWGRRLLDAGADWEVWRDSDWPSIATALAHGRALSVL